MAFQIAKENVIRDMKIYLEKKLEGQPKKLWENSFIRKQIQRRKDQETPFDIKDHMRAMVYAMLSGSSGWERFDQKKDLKTGRISDIDAIFCNYDWENLKKYVQKQEELLEKLKGVGNQSIKAQVDALLTANIPKLKQWDEKFGIETYYQQVIDSDGDIQALIKSLSDAKSENKMKQMGVSLVCEYLRNVGYDIPKPDRHVRRILGRDILAFSDKKEATEREVFAVIAELADRLTMWQAEVDYILWSYCADGYGICTKEKPCCTKCVVRKFCNHYLKCDFRKKWEGKYLLYTYYRIRENDSISNVVYNISQKSYLDFGRRMPSLQKIIDYHTDTREISVKISQILAKKIPDMLEEVHREVSDAGCWEEDVQKSFDRKHQETCEEILMEYGIVEKQSYGIAQRWINLILMHMAVIEPAMNQKYLPVAELRKYFHVPVDEYVIEAASTHVKERYKNGLYIPCAPKKHEIPDSYEMGWYVPGEIQPYEKWGYAEYMEFQNRVRKRLSEEERKQKYEDILAWAFQAFLEVSQAEVKREVL